MTKSVIIRAKNEEKLNEMIERAVSQGVEIQRKWHENGTKLPYVAAGYRKEAVE